MNIIFLGAPGAGKGTYAERVSAKYNIPHISTGDIFRANIKGATELGIKAKSYIDKGELVPDEVVIDLMADRLRADDTEDGYILDGFPRTIAQADALNRITDIDAVINLIVSDEEIVKRLSGRRVCSCGNTSHIKWLNDDMTCTKCGGTMYLRDDDREDIVLSRLNVYREQTAPLIGYYKDKGLLIDIMGQGEVDSVLDDIYGAIDKI